MSLRPAHIARGSWGIEVQTIKAEIKARFDVLCAAFGEYAGDGRLAAYREAQDALQQEAAERLATHMLANGGHVSKKGRRGMHGELVQWLGVETPDTSLHGQMYLIFGEGASYDVQALLRQHYHGTPVIDESGAAAIGYCRQVRW
jgi:hypothetical protein